MRERSDSEPGITEELIARDEALDKWLEEDRLMRKRKQQGKETLIDRAGDSRPSSDTQSITSDNVQAAVSGRKRIRTVSRG